MINTQKIAIAMITVFSNKLSAAWHHEVKDPGGSPFPASLPSCPHSHTHPAVPGLLQQMENPEGLRLPCTARL